MRKKPFLSPGASSFLENVRPSRLTAQLRRGEPGILLAAAVVGICAGALVALVASLTRLMHRLVFSVDGPLSAGAVSGPAALIGPVAGGIVLGAFIWLLSKRRNPRPPVDPIEANALHGGRMSMTESIIVCAQNVISNGFGASVGLEAGYTQIASGVASKFGVALGLRRADLRTLVGCAAAGAIAAAFDAPLTGTFYGIELIIGTYTPAILGPVIVSAIVAKLLCEYLIGPGMVIELGAFAPVMPADFAPAILLGIVCAAAGILLMQGVSLVEETIRRSSLPQPFRPVLGGLVVGLLALVSPQVLSAGHGALHIDLQSGLPLTALALILVMKSIASAVSIGSGFRGGLFFASLFLGSLIGQIFAVAIAPFHAAGPEPVIYAVIGMSALGAAVIGGPLAMTFLALELTGDFPIAVLVLAAVLTTSLVVRVTFGYSFATWRFHLRGEAIRSAHDIGWIRDLTVAKMMRADIRTVDLSMPPEAFRTAFPLGSTQRVVVVDASGRYAGIVLPPEVHADRTATPDASGLEPYLRYRQDVLLPTMNARQAAALFERTQSEALAVVDDRIGNRPIGLLTEAHTLRRYSEMLDQQSREMSGQP